jgi:hypothetical protein
MPCPHRTPDSLCEVDGRECTLFPSLEATCEVNPAAEKVPEVYETIIGLAEAYR